MVNAPSPAFGSATLPDYLDPVVPLRRTRSHDPVRGSHMEVDLEMQYAPQYHHLPPRPAQSEYLRYRNELLASLWTAQQQQQASAAALQSMYAQQPSLLPSYAGLGDRSFQDWATQGAPVAPQPRPAQAEASQSSQRRQEPHHRVYVLRCSHCDSFLSDRGMRAVLLLKPHITLFSTDVAPVNCGPLYGSLDEEPECAEEKVERTCECLTQSLGCFSCGNTVGYQIIAPCSRCTASVTKHSRPANGHRFVFHHNEVKYAERKYYPGEKGVRTDLVRHVSHYSRAMLQRQLLPSSPQPAPAPAPVPQPALAGDSKDIAPPMLPPVPQRAISPLPQRRSPYGLEEGDTIYWHYLVNCGELVRAVDPKSRIHTTFNIGR